MKPPLLLASLAATVSLVAIMIWVAIGDAQDSAGLPMTISLVENDYLEHFSFIDTSPMSRSRHNPRISPGDGFTIRGPLFDESKRRVGTIDGLVTSLGGASKFSRARSLLAHGVFNLRGGQIAYEGVTSQQAEGATFSVTGGTGAYEGARGTLTFSVTKAGTRDTIHLVP